MAFSVIEYIKQNWGIGIRGIISITQDATGEMYASDPAPSQRHNRYLDLGATASTWPGDDTFSVTWTQAENVRRYRIRVWGGAAGDHVRWVEDASNEAQAEAWLTAATSSSTRDVEYMRVFNFDPVSATKPGEGWTEWKELTKNPDDLSLSRLDFIGSSAGMRYIEVEAM